MKYLVTGATGFVGRALCAQLQRHGHSLVALSHSGVSLPCGTATHAIDLATTAIDVALLQGVDAVFHLAGVAHQRADALAYEQLNYRATLQLAQQARDAGVRSFVFLSSIKAMGPAEGETERGELDCSLPDDPYGLSKWRAECELRTGFAGEEMAVTIIRPALVYGPGAKGNLQLLAAAVRLGLPRPPLEGARSMIALPDLVRLLEEVAGRAGSGVKTWIATDGQRYSTREIYDLLRERAGKRPGRTWLPRWCWRLAAAGFDLLRPSPESTWSKLFATDLYSNEAVCRDVGWNPLQRLQDLALQPGEAITQ